MRHGTKRMRLGADSVRPFDYCCLGLTPPHDPVVTPDGYLYEREAIVANLLQQKTANRNAKRNVVARRERQSQQNVENAGRLLLADAAEFSARENALTTRPENHHLHSDHDSSSRADATKPWLLNADMIGCEDHEKAAGTVVSSGKTVCPMSRRPLKMSDLRAVLFTRNAISAETYAVSTQRGRYMCPVCSTTLTNMSRPAVLPSGHVLCGSCVDRFVMQEQRDPVTGQLLESARDVIYLRTGGTAFAASGGENKLAQQYQPSAR